METLPLCLPVSVKTNRFTVRASQRNKDLARKAGSIGGKDTCADYAALVHTVCQKRMPHLAQEILFEMKSEGCLPDESILSDLMLCYAENGFPLQAQELWEELLHSSFVLNVQMISELMAAYGRMGLFNEITKILDSVQSRNLEILPQAYSQAIVCLGMFGQLELMENTLREMVSKGFSVDSATGSAFIRYYSTYGSLTDMETAYDRLKRSRLLIDKQGIRAVSFAYLKECKFYRLGEFLRDVGLGRRDMGNLLWNLLLLSYAANFKMKSLQREFLAMVDAGFCPDLDTFNIRALAFARMSLFWDLHLSLEHMRHDKVVPDLVTYGCVVDAYLEKRLARNLDFAFGKMNLDDSPVVLTDPFVFEVLGKGDFHSSSEAFLEIKRRGKTTYRKLVAIYLKKQFRRNQIFWNY